MQISHQIFSQAILGCLIASIAIVNAQEPARNTANKSLLSGIDTQYFSKPIGAHDDFYSHVNQGWLDTTEIPPDRSNYGAFTALEDDTQEAVRGLIEAAAASVSEPGTDAQKVGDFYRSLTNIETRDKRGIEPIAPLLVEIRNLKSKNELAKLMALLQKQGVGSLFAHYIEPNARLSQQYAVYVTQSGLTMPDRDYYLEDEARYLELRQQMTDYAGRLLTAIGCSEPQAAANRILELETKVAKLQWTTIHLRRGVGAYDVIVGFATTTAQLGNVLATNIEGMPVDGALWVAWPKQTSGVATELTGDVVRRDGLAAGVVDVKVCAIDATWSGLKFVFRLADRVGR